MFAEYVRLLSLDVPVRSATVVGPTGMASIAAERSQTGRLLRSREGVRGMERLSAVVADCADAAVSISGDAAELFTRRHAAGVDVRPYARACQARSCVEFSNALDDAVCADVRELLAVLAPEVGGGAWYIHAGSLISTKAKSPGQVPHLDLDPGMVQFVINLTGGPATQVFRPASMRQTVSAAGAARVLGLALEELDAGLFEALDRHADLLLPVSELNASMHPAVASEAAGVVLGLRADVIHAGPPSPEARLVYFCVASATEARYDADYQVMPFTLPLVMGLSDPRPMLELSYAYKGCRPWDYYDFGSATATIVTFVKQLCNGELTLEEACVRIGPL